MIALNNSTSATRLASSNSSWVIAVPVGGFPAGSSIIVIFADKGGTDPVNMSVADAVLNSYSRDVKRFTSAQDGMVIFSAHNISALTAGQNITLSFGSSISTSQGIVIACFTGLATLSTLDKTVTNPTTDGSNAPLGTTFSSGATATTSQADELLIGAANLHANTTGETESPGGTGTWSLLKRTDGTGASPTGSNRSLYTQYQIVSATNTYNSQPTGSSHNFFAMIATYKAAATVVRRRNFPLWI